MDFRRFRKYLHGADQIADAAWEPPVGKGWHPILYKAFREIDAIVLANAGTTFRVDQIKEKFGTLRFYIGVSGDISVCERLRGIVDAAEEATNLICEDCGDEGKTSNWTGGWWRTLCRRHAAEALAKGRGKLPRFELWQLERHGNEFRLIEYGGLPMTFDGVRRHAEQVLDLLVQQRRLLEELDMDSPKWEESRIRAEALGSELSILSRSWWLTGLKGDLAAVLAKR